MEERPFSDLSYATFLAEDKLMGCRCSRCDTAYVRPRPICVKCHRGDLRWEEMTGRGKLTAFTCIAIGPSFMAAEGFNRHHPYCSGVVELDEGARVDVRIEGVDIKNPANIKIGMPLTAAFIHRQHGDQSKTYLAFAAQ